jgi:replicative DNA helicase
MVKEQLTESLKALEEKILVLIPVYGRNIIEDFGIEETHFRYYKHVFKAIKSLPANVNREKIIYILIANGIDEAESVAQVEDIGNDKSYFSYLASELKEKSLVFSVREKIIKSLDGSYDISTVSSVLENLRTMLVAEHFYESDSLSLQDVLGETLERASQSQEIYKFYVGYMDSKLNDFTSGNTIVIGARPGVGKTSFSLWSALNLAFSNIPVHFISMEMSVWQLGAKIYSIITNLSPSRIFSGSITEEEKKRIELIDKMFTWVPFKLTSLGNPTIQNIEEIMRKSVRQYNTRVFYLDYVQLIANPMINQSRHQEVASIVQKLKNLAIELNVAIVELSQLNRMGTKDPEMSHLKESGDIEQAASLVLLLWNEEKEEEEENDSDDASSIDLETLNDLDDISNIGKIISSKKSSKIPRYRVVNYRVEKHRNGPTFSGQMIFDSLVNVLFDPGIKFKKDEENLKKMIKFAYLKSPVGKMYKEMLAGSEDVL